MSMAVENVTDGVATVTYKYDSLEVSSGGQAMPLPQQQIPEITVKIDEQGKVISVEGLEGVLPPGVSLSNLPFDPAQFSGQTNVLFPEGGLAEPGDTWEATTNYPLPGSDQGVESRVTGKLLSVSEVEGRQVAEVEFAVDTPMDVTLDLGALMAQMGLDKLIPQGEGQGDLAFKMSIKGAQDFKGITRVDLESGAPVDLNGDMAIMAMTVEVIEAPSVVVPEDERGPMTIDITAKLELQQVD
jgi:hypothetical protein